MKKVDYTIDIIRSGRIFGKFQKMSKNNQYNQYTFYIIKTVIAHIKSPFI